MEKVKFLPLVLLSCYLVNVLVHGTSIQDALVIACLSGISAFFYYKEQEKQLLEFKKDLEEQNKLIKIYTERHDQLKGKVEGSLLAKSLGR